MAETELDEPKKKIYSKPALTDLGTVHELTEAVGKHGSRDGGAPPNQKTQV
jgi:hypothetical protein